MINLEVKRHELKYYINNLQYHSLVSRLKQSMTPDKFSTPHKGYFIRSLYFDCPNDSCLDEKLAGDMVRKKYRLRIYDTKTDKVKFEIKNKLGNQIFKETATISRVSAEEVISGNYEVLLDYNNAVLNKIYTVFTKYGYKPKVIIDYTRDAFVFDFFNVRLTFDLNIKSNNTNFDIFSDSLFMTPIAFNQTQVMEVKYNGHLPDYMKSMLLLDTYDRSSISKYALGRRLYKNNPWEDQ